jgi:hypothetical protein
MGRPNPIQSNAISRHRVTGDGIDGHLALTNEELRSKNMTAKQWAARAVVAATLAAGLSACGGGGDSAAPAVTPTPEVLTAGLTIKESVGDAPNKGSYNVKILDVLPNAIQNANDDAVPYPGATTYFFNDKQTALFGGTISIAVDGSVIQALLYGRTLQDKPVACGIPSINHPCVGFKVDPVAKTFTATSVILKAVSNDWTTLDTTPAGQVTVSGIVTQ